VETDLASPAASVAGSGMMNSAAPFRAWHNDFEHGTDGWYHANTPGALAWGGTITPMDRHGSAVAPSTGAGYAVVEVGGCVPAWAIFEPSGPYSPGAGYSTTFPSGGYVQELDVYLDPAWADGTGFTYVGSFALLDNGELRYFFIPVTKSGGALMVGGLQVTEEGWYTFRHVFGSGDGGELMATFQVARRGRTLHEASLTTTAYTGEPTASFQTGNVGSGYIWFDSYPASFFGTEFYASPVLAIEEHRVRPGR
jgi:hypothetical protein